MIRIRLKQYRLNTIFRLLGIELLTLMPPRTPRSGALAAVKMAQVKLVSSKT
jgi:hypothetical protein